MIITITGPSCTGKSTLEQQLVTLGLAKAISTTTRKPRHGEVNGKNYYFINQEQFTLMDANGQFAESVCFGADRYGIDAKQLHDYFAKGKSVVLVCEPVGRSQIHCWCKENGIQHVAVYLGNSPKVIAERFLLRFLRDAVPLAINAEPDDFANVVQKYAERLKIMMTTESSWHSMEHFCEYDLVIDSFTKENTQEAVSKIALAVVTRASEVLASRYTVTANFEKGKSFKVTPEMWRSATLDD